MRLMLLWYRDLLILACGGSDELLRFEECRALFVARIEDGLTYRQALQNVRVGEEMNRRMERNLPGFRQLISPDEIGSRGQVMFFSEYPRVPIKEELWPYEIDEE